MSFLSISLTRNLLRPAATSALLTQARAASGYFGPNKIVSSPDEALKKAGLKDGSKLLVGGFGLCGIPMACIEGVKKLGAKDLTVVSTNCGLDYYGLGTLLYTKQIKRMISSYIGENKEFERQYLKGELEVELTPQGNIAERLRCGGAGIPAYYTLTGAGTLVQEGGIPIKYSPTGEVEIKFPPRESKIFNGKEYLMEEAITGDIALVKAYKADTYGNLIFRGTANNFNADCARAAKVCIAEVEEIVEAGVIAPGDVRLPGVFVDYILKANKEKKLEKRTVRSRDPPTGNEKKGNADRERIARRAAVELKHGMVANLGIGVPTLAFKYLPQGTHVMLQSENGMLGMGDYPLEGLEDPDFMNAPKETVDLVDGASLFNSSESFGMIRGGHLDITILGALQVSQWGDIASWIIPGSMVKGMGGAMDLVASGSRVVVCMEHADKKGNSKVLKDCALPLTGKGLVNLIITEKAVFDVDNTRPTGETKLVLKETAPGVSVEDIRSTVKAEFVVADDIKPMQQL
eukprot:GHVR01042118.1.p1 GENE.GHVR01042118.1~~GHVR01042118.1.p1  ORF type:complete len:518 (+),score=94.30 GHVR01042118.1:60-1613(+)